MRNKVRNYLSILFYKRLFKGKTYYIIRRFGIGAGFFSNFHHVLGHIIYALERNLIPVVDMENFKTLFNEKEMINGTMNMWEYYFKQPYGIGIKDVYNCSEQIIISSGKYLQNKVPSSFGYYNDAKKINNYNSIIEKYMSFNSNTKIEIDKYEKELFDGKRNILGVQCRGSDYHSINGAYHNTVPAADAVIKKIKEILIPWDVEWVYLATEESETVNKFKNVFGDKLLVTNSARIENYRSDMGSSSEVDFNRKYDKYYKGLECIIDIILLSKCDSIIGGKVNGTMAAIEYNGNKYKNKYIFELGRNDRNGHSTAQHITGL